LILKPSPHIFKEISMKKYCVLLLALLITAAGPADIRAKCLKGNCTNGTGTMEWDTGEKYEGGWLKGTMHGHGTMIWKDGHRYVGAWKNGTMEGQGTLALANGDVYKGSFSAGRINGHGTMTWKTGDTYTGNWKNDLMHGTGTLRYKDGRVLKGTWKEGVFQEDGKADAGGPDVIGTWGMHCKCTPSESDNYECWDAVVQLLAGGMGKYQKRTGDQTTYATAWTMNKRLLTITMLGEDNKPIPGLGPMEFTYDPFKKRFNAKPSPFGPKQKKMVVCILKKLEGNN
jgi:hypothetical protein